jgi:hypothetical protein
MKCGAFIVVKAISLLFSHLTVVSLQGIINAYSRNIGAEGDKQTVSSPMREKKKL